MLSIILEQLQQINILKSHFRNVCAFKVPWDKVNKQKRIRDIPRLIRTYNLEGEIDKKIEEDESLVIRILKEDVLS